ncbi:MAG: CHAT domain-containing protein, partial [bacterium]|nr:CHAT domain-containing protein [bacterium]
MAAKILILAANPKDTSRLRLDEEVREIENGLQRAKHREQFEIKAQWAVRIQDVRRAMLDFGPNIVHFSGHGKGESGITFEDDAGKSHLVSAEALAGFFKLFAEHVRCVVLNACYSAVQAGAIVAHIPYVIGMSDAINDKAALEFAIAFYDALGAGKTESFAYELACNAIQMAGIEEHLIPVLFAKETENSGEEISSDRHDLPKQPQSIQIDTKATPPNLHNKIVEFL